MECDSHLFSTSKRNLRRTSSLGDDGEDVRKDFEVLRLGGLPGVAARFPETAPNKSFPHVNGATRCRAGPQFQGVPQSEPQQNRYLSGDLAMDGQRSNPGSLEALVVQCNLCCEEYCEDNPKLVPRNLSCGHTYCTGCLQKLFFQADKHSSTISCPTHCHDHTVVRGGKVSNIPKNYALLNVLRDITPTRRQSRKEEHDAVTKQVPKCPEHDDFLRSYCMDDGELVCSSCELYGSHKGHRTQFVSEAALEEKKRLKALRPDVLRLRDRMEKALYAVENICADTQKAGGKMEDEVDQYFSKIVALIEEKKSEVKTDIRMRTQLRVKALLVQARDLRERAEQASSVYQKSEDLIFADEYDVLREGRLALEQIEGVFVNPPTTTPKAMNDLKCSFREGVKDEVCASLDRAASIVPDIAAIDSSQITVEAFYDGFRVLWVQQNFVDNLAISYHLQMAKGEENFVNIYRGSTSKFTLKRELEGDTIYKFRVQVRTTEGVGVWSEPKAATRPEPSMRWHKKWRSVRVDLSSHDLEASRLGGTNHWGTFAADQLFDGMKQYYAEIEILSLGKNRSRDKLVIGLVSCSSKGLANLMDWQNGKKPIGEWDTPSLGFFPIYGLFKSHVQPGKEVAYGQDLKIQVGDRIGVLVDMGQQKLSFFCNGTDLGVAADSLQGKGYLLAVSIRDKIRVRLRIPPPPYAKRHIKLIKLRSSQLRL